MSNVQDVKFDKSHWGNYTSSVDVLGYKALVITGPIQGKIEPEFGRVVQVRKKSGAFGSDTVLIRKSDGNLSSFHNMGFFTVAEEFLPMYEAAMKEVDERDIDKEGDIYIIEGKSKAIGFVVEGLDDTNGESYSFAVTIKSE